MSEGRDILGERMRDEGREEREVVRERDERLAWGRGEMRRETSD